MTPSLSLRLTALAAAAILAVPAAAQDSENMTLLGSRATHPFWSADIWGYEANGIEIAIIGVYNGTSFNDVTDPSNITEVFFLPGVDTIWRDIKTYQNYAYIVNDFNGEDIGEGIRVIDMTDPLNPIHVRDVTDRSLATHNVWIDQAAGLLFTTDNDTHVYDLNADPSNPTWLYTFSEYYIHDMYSRDGVAYMAAIFEGYLATVDLTNLPASMTTLDTQVTDDAFTHNAWLTDDGTHALTTDERSGGHITAVDVSDPSNLSVTGSWVNSGAPSSIVHNVIVKNDLAYAAWYTDGINVLDVSDPSNITRVAYYDTYPANDDSGFEGAWGAYCFAPSGNIYVSDINTGLYIFSVDGIVSTPPSIPGSTAQMTVASSNPFRTRAVVRLALERATRGRLDVFDSGGRFVARLGDGLWDAGEHLVNWDARDARGRSTAPGVYHVRLTTPEGSAAMKLVRAK